MENMTEIAPNQLPLFADMLTVEQEQRVTDAKASATKQMQRQKNEVLQKMKMVIDAGFSPAQYGYSTDCKKLTRSINVNRWDAEPKHVEVELDQFNGNFYIIFDEYDKTKNEIIKRKAGIDISGNKMECYWLNQNSRKMKPETILANMAKAAENAKYKYDTANKIKSTVEYTINKYKKLYPDAEVKAGRGYTSGTYREYDKVIITFKSGSYVELEIGTTPDREYVLTKYDAVFKSLSINEVMDYFNAQ
jgi:hypothetical protein